MIRCSDSWQELEKKNIETLAIQAFVTIGLSLLNLILI